MLFSYTLLFAILTTFVAAAPTVQPVAEQNTVPQLSAPIELLGAAEYLDFRPPPGNPAGWTRLPSADKSVSRFYYLLKDYTDRIRRPR
jgi:hypothetical protein